MENVTLSLKVPFVIEFKDRKEFKKQIVSTWLEFLALHPVIKKIYRDWIKHPETPLEKNSFVIRKQEPFELID
ncbi:MAG: hypothetical protein ACUZ8I_14305 [Candidatus Scalindua sp.]